MKNGFTNNNIPDSKDKKLLVQTNHRH